jgi:hypothetical protein
MAVKHETCLEYFQRRLREGWQCISLEGYKAVLLSPDGIRRELDLENDVETLRPSAPGDECNITNQSGASCPNHYQNVDEASPDDGSTTVYTNNATYLRDLYNIATSGVGAGTINKITVYAIMYCESGYAYPSMKICIKAGQGNNPPDTVSESPEKQATDYTWKLYSHDWATNPKTSSAWTWEEIDNLQIGVALKRPTSYASNCFCTQVYVEVDYTAITEKTSSDSGSGSEAKVSGSPLVSLSQSDGGSGVESTPAQEATLVGSETGSGLEAILKMLGKLVSDAGSGAEDSQITIITASKSSSDTGAGTEAASLLAEFGRDETGEGVEALLARLLHHTDSGLGNDTVFNLLVVLSGVETGTGTDSLLARLLEAGETSSGMDELLSRELSLIDSGSGMENAAIYKILLATDGGGGLDALASLLALITSSEVGYSSEKLGVKIMTSPGAGDMKLPTKMGKAGVPH